MRLFTFGPLALGVLALAAFTSGCSESTADPEGPVEVSWQPPASAGGHHGHGGHGHGSGHQGAHGGHVIELGRDHQYHVELVDDARSGTVTAYILDHDMQELAIDQASIVINLVVEGRARSFELLASGATQGMASRFSVTDVLLVKGLHDEASHGKLRVTIGGTPYVGNVGHLHHDRHADNHGHLH